MFNFVGLVEWNVPKGGMFIWIKVNKIKDVMELTNKCISQGVFLIPGHAFNYDYSKLEQHLRICYSYATPEEIDKVLIFFNFNFLIYINFVLTIILVLNLILLFYYDCLFIIFII